MTVHVNCLINILLHVTGSLKDVRLLTKKGSNESKGCAFVEFETEKAHKVCLHNIL